MPTAVRASLATVAATGATDVRVQLDARRWRQRHQCDDHLRRPARADAAPAALAAFAFDAAGASPPACTATGVFTAAAITAAAALAPQLRRREPPRLFSCLRQHPPEQSERTGT